MPSYFMFLYLAFFASSFMYLIHAFWFVAVEAAERMTHSPLYPISWASSCIWLRPIVSVSAWLMKSWRQFESESNETTLMPAAIACFSAGQTACGSFAAMTMPAACDWIAAWIAGCCAAAVSAVPDCTFCVLPSAFMARLPPWSAMTSYGFSVSFGMK